MARRPTISTIQQTRSAPVVPSSGNVPVLNGLGRGLSAVANQTLALGREEGRRQAAAEAKLEAARNTDQLSEAFAKSQRELNDLRFETEQQAGTDFKKSAENYVTAAREIRDRYATGVEDEETRKRYSRRIDDAIESNRVTVRDKSYGRAKALNQERLTTSLEEMAESVPELSADAVGSVKANAEKLIQDHVRDGWITSAQGEAAARGFEKSRDASVANAIISDDPSAAIRLLKDGETFPSLGASDRRTLIAQAERAVRRGQSETRAQLTKNLSIINDAMRKGVEVSPSLIDETQGLADAVGAKKTKDQLGVLLKTSEFTSELSKLPPVEAARRVRELEQKPALQNRDGSTSTEETITIQDGSGGWVNIPTIVGGKRIGEDVAAKRFADGKLKAVNGVFATLDEAVAAAKTRSDNLGVSRAGETEALRLAKIGAGRRVVNAMQRALLDDPLSFAALQGVVKTTPFSGGVVPEVWGPERVTHALTVAEHYKVGAKFFTDDEADTLVAALKDGDTERKVAIVAGISKGFGQYAQAALAEIDIKSPVDAHIGALVNLRGVGIGRDAYRGQQIMKDKLIAKPPSSQVREAVTEELGTALTGSLSRRQSQIEQTATAIYAARAYDQGIEGFNKEVFREAVQAASGRSASGRGGIGSWNGRKIILPSEMSNGELTRVIQGFDAAALGRHSFHGGLPAHVTLSGKRVFAEASELQDAFLVTRGDGRYWVSTKDPSKEVAQYWIDSKTGNRYVLDLTDPDKVEMPAVEEPKSPPHRSLRQG